MTALTSFRTAADGTRLFTHRWENPRPHAAIVVVHGLGEHLGRYTHVGPQFVERGFDVRGSDTRGFGGSEGPRAYVRSFETLLDDIQEDVRAAAALGVPVVLLGHSLGGLESLLYAASDRQPPSLLVLSSPAIHNSLPRAQILMARTLSKIAPRLVIKNPVDATQLSTDQSVGERYVADPLVIQKSTVGFGTAAFAALDAVPAALERLSVPTLVTHGAEDTIVAPWISEPLAALPGVTRVVYDGYRHEPFNEDGGRRAVTTIADWIDAHLSAA